MRQIKKKKNCGVEIFKHGNLLFFHLSKIYSAEFFLILPVVTGLVCKIDAINGKKWVKFVAMQQNSATLIHDLGPLHMSPVNRAGSVSEISPRHSFLCKNIDVFI